MTRSPIGILNVLITLAVVVVGVLIWASDKITLQGERTIYSVQCRDGVWEGWRCTGTLVASDRYRFLASRSRHEVIFWVAGSRQPSGKYTNCIVKDRDNWKCDVPRDQALAVTDQLARGRPASDGSDLAAPFHAARKWKWWLLRFGIHGFSNADY